MTDQLTVVQPQARAIQIQEDKSPAAMMIAALNQGATLEQFEKMMDLQERWEKREAEKVYNTAFAAFKAQAVKVIKGRKVTGGPLKGRSYSGLHDVVNAVTPALSAHGLSASWKITRDEKDWIEITCTLKHTSGHSESVSMGGPPDTGGAKNLIQARASSITYLERYTLKAICGVAEEDDDNDGRGTGQDDLTQGWIDYCLSIKSDPDSFKQACKDARAAISQAKDRQGLERFNREVGAL